MRRLTGALLLILAFGLAACGQKSKFQSYDGPDVTRVVLFKSQRKLYLLSGRKVLRQFPVGLGFAPSGDKLREGDGRTPEGDYFIDKRNPNSAFHLSIGMSYPNATDIAMAKAMGVKPGGDIFIHGGPRNKSQAARGRDWTAGCIAVTDRQIEEIYAMVRDGTIISVRP